MKLKAQNKTQNKKAVSIANKKKTALLLDSVSV